MTTIEKEHRENGNNKQDEPKVERLELEEYLRKGEGKAFQRGSIDLSKLPPIKQMGFLLALGVTILIILATGLIFYDYLHNNPLNDPGWQQRLARCCDNDPVQAIQVYRELQNISLDRITRLFTLLIASTLFPLLTSIIGYLFGSRQIEKGNKEDDET